ncbi:response regulator [Paenibacillus tarimensis]
MYRVMIVDDEPLIREGLQTIVEWESYGFEVAATAADGLDALSSFNEMQIDLVIADIRMPGMDGLKLIEALRRQDKHCHILISSGYADFEYAKRAIEFKVDGYILKPVEEEDLIGYLEQIRAELDKRSEQHQFLQNEVERHREVLIQTLLNGSHLKPDAMDARAGQLQMNWKSYQVALVVPDDQAEGSKGAAELKRILSRIMERHKTGVAFTHDQYTGILLSDAYRSDDALQRLSELMEPELRSVRGGITIAIGAPEVHLGQIKSSFDEALQFVKQRFFAPVNRVLSRWTTPALSGTPDKKDRAEIDIESYTGQLFYAMDVGNKQSMAHLIGQAGREMTESGLTEQAVKTNYAQMVATALNRIIERYPELKSAGQETIAWVATLYGHSRMEMLQREIIGRLDAVIDSLGEADSDTLVKKMVDFIERNYSDHLKLETLAEIFNYNSAYLGKLFKNYTGEYFNTYLDKVRIKNARKLLEEGLKVYQVAERVGYTNVDYFHTKFKKYIGMSPSAYKNK